MIFRDETRNSLCLRHHHFNYVVVAAADAAAAAVIRRIWLHTLYARKSALRPIHCRLRMLFCTVAPPRSQINFFFYSEYILATPLANEL